MGSGSGQSWSLVRQKLMPSEYICPLFGHRSLNALGSIIRGEQGSVFVVVGHHTGGAIQWNAIGHTFCSLADCIKLAYVSGAVASARPMKHE